MLDDRLTPEEIAVSERAEKALRTSAEAYRIVQEAQDMRSERDACMQRYLDLVTDHTALARRLHASEQARREMGAAAEKALWDLDTSSIHSSPKLKFEHVQAAREGLAMALAALPPDASDQEGRVVRDLEVP